jgi:hypothetical protein
MGSIASRHVSTSDVRRTEVARGWWLFWVTGVGPNGDKRWFDAELEPRWQRWRLSVRTKHGAADIATLSQLGHAEDQIVDWITQHGDELP